MPNVTVKERKYTTAELSAMVPNSGTVLIDVTKKALVVGDGVTAGGVPAAKETHTHADATTSVAGFMSAADKTKLDGLSGSSLPPAATLATPNTIVLRDASGNFSVNTMTGNVTGNVSGSAASITGNLTGDVTSVGMVTTLPTTGVSAGTYGTSTQVPQFTVDSKGRVTAVSNVVISSTSGPAGGDLTGTYPNPSIKNSGVVAGTFGSATQVGQFTVNAKGIITSAANVSVAGTPPGGAAGGDLTGTYPNPTVATVGGATSANIAAGVSLANASTATATANTIPRRDSNGKFKSGQTQVGDASDTVTTKLYVDTFSGGAKHAAIFRRNAGVQEVSIDGAAFTTVSASTFSVPSNVGFIEYYVIGAGGGGCGTNNNGGAAGAVRSGVAIVVPGSSLTVSVGTGGAGGSGGNGSAGGSSSISGLANQGDGVTSITASGGNPGTSGGVGGVFPQSSGLESQAAFGRITGKYINGIGAGGSTTGSGGGMNDYANLYGFGTSFPSLRAFPYNCGGGGSGTGDGGIGCGGGGNAAGGGDGGNGRVVILY